MTGTGRDRKTEEKQRDSKGNPYDASGYKARDNDRGYASTFNDILLHSLNDLVSQVIYDLSVCKDLMYLNVLPCDFSVENHIMSPWM